jgi:predicted transcriptional regulator
MRRQRSDAGTGLKQRALKAVLSGYCNTTRDVADELDVPIDKCQPYVSQFINAGIIRKTGRHIPNISPDGRGPKNYVFEVVA